MADPDLRRGGGGGAVIQTPRGGGGGGRAFGPHFGLKIRWRGGRAPRAPPLDPPLKLGEVITMLLIP